MIDVEVLAVQLTVCPRCGARPGQMCRTARGLLSQYPHSPRTDVAYKAWSMGHDAGRAQR